MLRVYVRFTPSFGRANWARRRSQIDPKEKFAVPENVEHWSLTALREKLIKIGAKVMAHGRYVTFQLAEVTVPRGLIRKIVRLNRNTISANLELIWGKSVN